MICNASAAVPRNINDLQPFRNYFTLDKVGEFLHRFEAYFTQEHFNPCVLTLRGNTAEEIGPYPWLGAAPAILELNPKPFKGVVTRTDNEPERFKNMQSIPENVKHLANAVEAYLKTNYSPLQNLKIRYEGSLRQIELTEMIRISPGRGTSVALKQAKFTALHQQGTHVMTGEMESSGVGNFHGEFHKLRFIPFTPSEEVQGALLTINNEKSRPFQEDWARFASVVCLMIENKAPLFFPPAPQKFTQRLSYEIRFYPRKPMAQPYDHDVKFEFTAQDVLRDTIFKSQKVACFQLDIELKISLEKKQLDLKIKEGSRREFSRSFTLEGDYMMIENQKILNGEWKVKGTDKAPPKKSYNANAIELKNEADESYLSVIPASTLSDH